MPYKDKDRQRESVKKAQAKRRQGITKGITSDRVLHEGITVDAEKAGKLLMICKSLDKDTTGLSGKKENLLDLVRYGINGPTMREVKDKLT